MLNSNTLGTALYNVRNNYSNKTAQQLIDTYGSIENARLSQAKDEADVIIGHFINNISLNIPGTGLTAGAVAVAGASVTGTIS
jgi:hypothetical protein